MSWLINSWLVFHRQENMTNVYLQIYTRVYNRFGPYVIGLGLGYLLHKTRNHNVKLRAVSICLNCLSYYF